MANATNAITGTGKILEENNHADPYIRRNCKASSNSVYSRRSFFSPAYHRFSTFARVMSLRATFQQLVFTFVYRKYSIYSSSIFHSIAGCSNRKNSSKIEPKRRAPSVTFLLFPPYVDYLANVASSEWQASFKEQNGGNRKSAGLSTSSRSCNYAIV